MALMILILFLLLKLSRNECACIFYSRRWWIWFLCVCAEWLKPFPLRFRIWRSLDPKAPIHRLLLWLVRLPHDCKWHRPHRDASHRRYPVDLRSLHRLPIDRRYCDRPTVLLPLCELLLADAQAEPTQQLDVQFLLDSHHFFFQKIGFY